MAGRFPGASDIARFWQLLASGQSALETLEEHELLESGVSPKDLRDPRYVRVAAPLADHDGFDAELFGYSPREAKLIDPQHRAFLEACFLALEDAAIAPRDGGPVIGVFGGAGGSVTSYVNANERVWQSLRGQTASLAHLAVDKDFLTTRVSYKLNLSGPSFAVQTSTSSSLVAVDLACQSLASGDCDIALVGGSTIRMPHRVGYLYEEGGVLSRDGKCRPFDEDADGTVFGNGVGVVVLKRIDDAIADRDRIRAVLLGSAVVHDGAAKESFTISSSASVARLVELALRRASVDVRTISLCEAHATGTVRGDPVEFAGLARAFGKSTGDRGFCGISSVKGNVGHLEAAAGITSLIKCVLALEHGLRPATLHVRHPNAKLEVDDSPFEILRESAPFATDRPARALVNSLGLGGTNACVILEAAPPRPARPLAGPTRSHHVLTLSAATEEALNEQASQYVTFLRGRPTASLHDICFTANTGRVIHGHRLSVVGSTPAELADYLEASPMSEAVTSTTHMLPQVWRRPPDATAPVVAFLFTGQGTQYLGMARTLIDELPSFAASMAECDALVRARTGRSILDVLYGADEPTLQLPANLQPCIVAVQISVARILERWGVRPHFVLGHSLGEYSAACFAGGMSLESLFDIVCERGRMTGSLPPGGAMATVFASEAAVDDAIADHRGVSIAAHNSSDEWVLSGVESVLETVLNRLSAEGARVRRFNIGFAGHSPLLEPILGEYEQMLARIPFDPLRIPLVSTLTGKLANNGELATAAYWRDHLRHTVRCAEGLGSLYELGANVFVEIGPHPSLVLSAAMLGTERGATDGLWLPTLSRKRNDWEQLLGVVGALHARGIAIDWAAFDSDFRPTKVAIPTYPFQRRTYNLLTESVMHSDAPREEVTHSTPPASTNALGRRLLSPFLRDVVYESEAIPLPMTVFGKRLASMTWYLQLALEAAADLDADRIAIQDVSFVEPIPVVAERGRKVQTIVRRTSASTWTFEVHSAFRVSNRWMLHCHGSFVDREARRERPRVDPIRERARCNVLIEGPELYAQLEARGYVVTELQRRVRRARLGERSIVAELEAAPGVDTPALRAATLLDAATHALLLRDPSAKGSWLPIGFERIRIPAHLPDQMVATARIRRTPTDGKTLTADILFTESSGRPVASISGYYARLVEEESLSLRGREPSDWSYELAWQAEPARREQAPQLRSWLIVASDPGFASAIAAGLELAGAAATIVTVDDDGLIPSNVLAQLPTTAPSARIQGVVNLLPASVDPGAPLIDILEPTTGSTLALVHAIERSSFPERPRLFVVTRGAQPVFGNLMNKNQAPAWGLGRAIAAEIPELFCTCVDLDADADDGGVGAIVESLLWSDRESQIAYRHGKRYVGRLVRGAGSRRRLNVPQKQPFRAVLQSPGLFENVVYEPLVRRMPGPYDVDVLVQAHGITFKDVLDVLGVTSKDKGGGIGFECAGVVTAIGAAVTKVAVGDPVVVLGRTDMASHVVAEERFVARKPIELSFEQAAGLPVSFVAAWLMLHSIANLQPGQTVLVHGAAGGIGQAVIQLVHAAGATAIATASPIHRELLHQLGVEHVFSSRTDAFAGEVMDATNGRGVDLVLHSLQDRFLPTSASCLRQRGILIDLSVGANNASLAGIRPDVRQIPFDLESLFASSPAIVADVFQRAIELVETRALQPVRVRAFSIAELPMACRRLMSARHSGKVVISRGTLNSETVAPPAASFDPLATYVIAGGEGEERDAIIEHLTAAGVTQIVCLGGPPVASPFARHIDVDLSDRDAVSLAMREAHGSGRPIRGVFFLPDPSPDLAVKAASWEAFQGHILRTAWAAQSVDMATQRLGLPLDFFYLFSSASALMGVPGRALEATLGAYLDGIAHLRAALGLPATTVNWGWFGEEDTEEETGDAKNWARGGAGALPRRTALHHMLQSTLGDPPVQTAVIPVRWDAAVRLHPALRGQPFFARVLSELGDPRRQSAAVLAPLEMLRATPPARQRAALREFVEATIVKVLGFQISQRLDPRQGFVDLGLDSLLAVELRNTLQQALGLRLSHGLTFSYPNLEVLSDYLYEKVFPPDPNDWEEGPASFEMSSTDTRTLNTLLDAELDEVAALLSDLPPPPGRRARS